jgi:hypothetical protein
MGGSVVAEFTREHFHELIMLGAQAYNGVPGIYALINPLAAPGDRDAYVGKTGDLYHRLINEHIAYGGASPGARDAWAAGCTHPIVLEALDDYETMTDDDIAEHLHHAEQWWIYFGGFYSDALHNQTSGGGRAYVHSDEARAKMSAGIKAACQRPEVKQKRSRAFTQSWADPHSRSRRLAALSESWRGPAAEERRAHISKLLKGNKHGVGHRSRLGCSPSEETRAKIRASVLAHGPKLAEWARKGGLAASGAAGYDEQGRSIMALRMLAAMTDEQRKASCSQGGIASQASLTPEQRHAYAVQRGKAHIALHGPITAKVTTHERWHVSAGKPCNCAAEVLEAYQERCARLGPRNVKIGSNSLTPEQRKLTAAVIAHTRWHIKAGKPCNCAPEVIAAYQQSHKLHAR